ncbi:diguanylate cyclase, partial [bacterium]|nr:diguanylate cyclase [bacterium]
TESMDQAGFLLSSTLALACQDPMIRQSYDELIPYTERIILGGEDIKEVSIFDETGKYIAHRLRGESQNKLGQMLDGEKAKKFQELEGPNRMLCQKPEGPGTKSDDCVEFISPIRIGSAFYGSIVLRYTFDRLTRAKSVSRQRIIIISIIAMIAGIVLSAFLAQFIASGLDTLMKGTSIVSTGDLSYRLTISSRDEIGLLASRFNEMVVALEGNQKTLDRKIFEIETLFKASQAMNFQSDTEKLVHQILGMASTALKAERGSMMLLVDQTDELATKIVFGLDGNKNVTEPPVVTKIKSGEGVAGMVLKEGRSIIVNEGHSAPIFKSFESTSNFEQKIRNLISVPLKFKDMVTGVINVVNKTEAEGFNPDDQRLLEALAQQAAMAVEHARLYELAITDGLTKLYIHRYFQARLEEEVVRAKRYHAAVSLILFDIDHFKKFNDTYGHQQGDIVLVEVAKLVKLTVRETVDIPARYGGEEFTVILPETDAQGAFMVAERLRKTVETYEFPGPGKTLTVTISIGIATFPDHATNRAVLIKKADIALYHCKERGRNCSSIFNDSMSS